MKWASTALTTCAHGACPLRPGSKVTENQAEMGLSPNEVVHVLALKLVPLAGVLRGRRGYPGTRAWPAAMGTAFCINACIAIWQARTRPAGLTAAELPECIAHLRMHCCSKAIHTMRSHMCKIKNQGNGRHSLPECEAGERGEAARAAARNHHALTVDQTLLRQEGRGGAAIWRTQKPLVLSHICGAAPLPGVLTSGV